MSLTPKTAMRLLCQDCLGMVQFNRKMVADCQGDTAQRGGCPLYPFRLGRVSVKALRKHCLWCAGGSKEYVRECPTETCSLYIYRYGRNPAKKRQFKPLSKISTFEDGGRFLHQEGVKGQKI